MKPTTLKTHMRQPVLILSILVGSLIGLFLYCAALIDWVQDYKTGIYAQNQLEAILETSGVLLYSYAGFRFLQWRVRL
ncbi:hypothetical protein EXU85_23030 [Spirosoma sp. KCTC 42546]|uniref:hypothetical protein n=1 Tax=Spirosoma sp. KCTC 42546 TaxID=2520506 RepID=UPI0011591C28|nr:hypothetical protein [Spirosoma sp. KCTC 42546]QDK81326.1 hypothetical protein EXU85_23030 [Spirosoma sp. KCTC 42546]